MARDQQRGRSDGRQRCRRIESAQRVDPSLQRLGPLEMRKPGGVLRREPRGVVGHPGRGIEEQRLCPHIGGGTGVAQQREPRLEAAARVRIHRGPAVHHDEGLQTVGRSLRE
ncbi:MAG: hypothetical protein J0H35_14075, partial [Rhodospirillales bacterium]|nr:hypothetical protein [Rhodospirillales bacterium]